MRRKRSRFSSTRLGERAAVFAQLLGSEIVHVGVPVLDQLDRGTVEHLEIV
jgi:hypothetical protein